MSKQYIFIILFIISITTAYIGIDHIKNNALSQFQQKYFLKTVEQSELYLKTLIKEKQNTTAMIATSLTNSENVLSTLKGDSSNSIDLKKYSLKLRETTDFKNVWFQLISKKGISLQRSWTDKKNDSLVNIRIDVAKMIKNPKVMNTISVGKFDLSFKSMIPVFDDKNTFLGIIEVITHFNSISKKLKKNGIESVILADKKYKKQLTKAFTKKFAADYYVANLDAPAKLLHYLQQENIEEYISNIKLKPYYLDKKLDSLVTYYGMANEDGTALAHFLLFNSLQNLDISKINEINYVYNLYKFFAILLIVLIFYLMYRANLESRLSLGSRALTIVIITYVILAVILYILVELKHNNDIKDYRNSIKKQTLVEYNSIIDKNRQIAQLIYDSYINIDTVKELLKQNQRGDLYKQLKPTYIELIKKYNIRQIHFHLPDSQSFLRMHRPKKYGDSLKGIRESVDYVNKFLKPYYGFEEGRIFNGFRYVFPLFHKDRSHIGSVEVSFDIYSFMDNYFNIFNASRVNFLLNKSVINEKVFNNEQSNYIKSPIKDFYFDKLVLQKLREKRKDIVAAQKDKKKLLRISETILKGEPFTVHFGEVEDITTIIPLINNITNKVVGSINISKKDTYIQQRDAEFYQLLAVLLIILGFIMVFIYREIISKYKIKLQSIKNKKILDSQHSFIIITDGSNIQLANNSMLKFFNYKTLEEFKTEHNCICELFENEDGKNYIQRYMGEQNWFEYIKNNQDEHKVKFKSHTGEYHIFKIEYSQYNIEQNQYIISFLDITQLENVNSSLKKTTNEQTQLLSLFNKSDITLFKWKNDTKRTVEYVSDNVSKLLGYEKDDFLSGKIHYEELINENDLITIQTELETLLNTNDDFLRHTPYQITTKKREKKYILTYQLLIKDSDQRISHFLGYLVDITHIKTIEHQLIQSEKMSSLGNMIGNIAHQWRQPLSVISTSASTMQLEHEYGTLNGEKMTSYCDSIVNSTNFLSQTIDTFRDFIKEKKELKEVVIQDRLNLAIKISEPSLKNNHIALINNIDYQKDIVKELPIGELVQVLTNILNNAKDALVNKNIQNGWIKISCTEIQDTIVITIEDNAGGIDEEIMPQIFEPYFTTKHQSQGTGLGLYMSHKIVSESLRGKLYAQNTSYGAKFIIELPSDTISI